MPQCFNIMQCEIPHPQLWDLVDVIWPSVDEIWPKVDEIWPSVDEIWPKVDEIWPSVDEIWPGVDEIWPRLDEIWPSCWCNLAERLERLTANAKCATVLGSIPASSDTVETEGRQMKQYWIKYITKCIQKSPCLAMRSTERVTLLTPPPLNHRKSCQKSIIGTPAPPPPTRQIKPRTP